MTESTTHEPVVNEPAAPQVTTEPPPNLGSLPAEAAEKRELIQQSICNSEGRELIRALTHGDFACFFLLGEDGEPRAMVSLGENDVPQIVLADSQRRNVLNVALNENGSLTILPL